MHINKQSIVSIINKKPKQILLAIMAISLLICFWNYLWGIKYFAFYDIGSDTVLQYQPFFHAIVDDVNMGNIGPWTFNYGLGSSTLISLSWCMDPFTWPTFLCLKLFGIHIAEISIAWMQVLKILLCSFICYSFLSEFKFKNSTKILASYAYSFCGFLMLWGQHYQFSTGFLISSLVFLFLERSLKRQFKLKDHILLALSVAWLAAKSYYFAYMVLIAAAIYACFRLFHIYAFRPVRSWMVCVLRILAFVLTGLLISGIVFLPQVHEAMNISGRLQTGFTLWNLGGYPADRQFTILARFLSNNLQGINDFKGSLNYYEAEQLFFTSFQLMFFVFYIVLGIKKGWKCVVARCCMIGILMLILFTPQAGFVLNGFAAPTGRYTYVLMPCFVIIMARVLDAIIGKEISFVHVGISAVLYGVIFVLLFMNESIHKKYLLFIVVSYIALNILILLYRYTVSHGTIWKIGMVVILLINVFVDSWITTNQRTSLSEAFSEKNIKNDVQNVKMINEALPRDNEELFRVEKTYTDYTWFNDAMVEDYFGVSFYNSIVHSGIRTFFENCWDDVVFQGTACYIQFEKDYLNSDMAALLGVKYLISNQALEEHPHYELVDTYEDLYVYLNTDYTGFGHFYTGSMTSEEYLNQSENERERTLQDYLILDQNTPLVPSNANVLIQAPSEDHITGTVTCDVNGFVFLPIPYEKGWSAKVNGIESDVLKADYGFMAIPVNTGNNELILEYHILYLKEGMVMTLFGICVLIILSVLMRRNIRKMKI